MKRYLLAFVLFTYGASAQYHSERLLVKQLTENTFIHTSYLQTNDFGRVSCNGLLVRNGHEVVIFDTPTNDASSIELIRWVKEVLKCQIVAVVPTHFHEDCLGGLAAFHAAGISSVAHDKTIELASQNQTIVPQKGFHGSISLSVGGQQTLLNFFGEGHTRDNVVAYFPAEQVMFGGCLIKEMGATKGYLGDANVNAWSATIAKLQAAYPQVKHVVPGHGAAGDSKLLEYTRRLFID